MCDGSDSGITLLSVMVVTVEFSVVVVTVEFSV